jgi:hypothetical protein
LDFLNWTIKLVVNAVMFEGCLLNAFAYTEASPKLILNRSHRAAMATFR